MIFTTRIARSLCCIALLPLSVFAQTAIPVTDDAAAADFSSSIPYAPVMRVVVGRTVTVNARHRLTKVYVTDPTVLLSYTASPNQVLVTAKQAGVSSLVLWDEAGESRTYFFSADVDIARLQGALKQAMPNELIEAQGDQGRVILTGNTSSVAFSDSAVRLAALYSKEVSNTIVVNSAAVKQVRLKVRIVEVDRSKLDQFAFNFFSAGGKNLASTTTSQFPSTLSATTSGSSASGTGTTNSVGQNTVSISNPLNFLLYSSQLNVGAMLQDLESRQILQILAEPNITTLSGLKANFLAGGEFPFPVVQGTSGGLTSISVQFRPYGVKVEFLPIVNVDGSIQLSVSPEVSALDYTNAVTISGYTIPALSTRRADTQVVLKSGQSFAISGLLDKRTTDSLGSTPGIASIPILGKLFKSKSINHSTSELIVIVTPEIVDPLHSPDHFLEPLPAVPFLDPKVFDARLPKVQPN
jgi:pilus assembly protein CpaC